jgi:hypothetical protein
MNRMLSATGPSRADDRSRNPKGTAVNTDNPTIVREDGIFYTALAAKDRPCARCPFLVENFDKVGEPPLENEGTYLPSTRSDLWNHGARQDGCSLGSEQLEAGVDLPAGCATAPARWSATFAASTTTRRAPGWGA